MNYRGKVSFKKQIEGMDKFLKRMLKNFEKQKQKEINYFKGGIVKGAKKQLMGKKVRFSENGKVLAVVKVDRITFDKDPDILFEVGGSSPYADKEIKSDFKTRYCVPIKKRTLIEIIR